MVWGEGWHLHGLPHVAGVAAMVFAVNPDLRGEDVKRIIVDSVVGSYGRGRLWTSQR